MASATDTTTSTTSEDGKPGWSLIGPGLVVAATGVGAADLVATLIAGSKYGYALLWTVVVGCVMKIVLVEGAGRYSLATGRTIYEGWSSLGKWTHWYFGPYIVIWGFVYGAAAMAGTGLALHSLMSFLSVPAWGILSGLIGLALVWWGHYSLFEKVCAALVGIMFVTMVGAAILTLPNLPELAKGLVPLVPDGALVNVLSVAGGVGGTITLAAYGYWIREKGWTTPGHMRVMRIDNGIAYLVTGIFVIATLVVGAELLYSANIAIKTGDQGLLNLSDVLSDRYGAWAGSVFLVGFWSAAMSSLIGVWNGVSHDVRGLRGARPWLRPGPPRQPPGWPLVPRLHPVADVPAHGDAVPRQAGLPDPRLRSPRGVLHAVPVGDPALAAQHRPDPARMAQQAAVQHRHGAVRCRLHRPGRQRAAEGGARRLTGSGWMGG